MGFYPTDKYKIKIIPSKNYSKKPPFGQKTVKGKKKFNDLASKLLEEGFKIKATNIAFYSGNNSMVEIIIPQVPI